MVVNIFIVQSSKLCVVFNGRGKGNVMFFANGEVYLRWGWQLWMKFFGRISSRYYC